MIGNSNALLLGAKRNLFAMLAASTVFVTGCSNMSSTAPNIQSIGSAATLKGKLHGGNQPVSGADVYLWYAGQKGQPGSPASQAAHTTTASDGSFTFSKDTVNGNSADNGTTDTFTCPKTGSAAGDPLVYVIAKGGDTINDGGKSSNTAAEFIAIYGTCDELTSANQVSMTEVTTAATMAAVSQFFDPATETITADGTGQEKTVIDQMPATIALLADSTTGLAVTSTTIPAATTGSNINPNVSVVATPEYKKLNLIADIISSCINNANASATPCSTTLFGSAVSAVPNTTANNPAGGTFPTTNLHTLQALYYMFTNPASINSATTGNANMIALYGLAGGTGAPYQPYSDTQPTDWTIAIKYSSSSTCGTLTGGSGNFINSPIDIAVDSNDNIWFANSQSTTGNLSEISSAGIPTTCILPGTGTAGETGAQGGIVIDSASSLSESNVWVGTINGLYRYNSASQTPASFSTSATPLALGADGAGNVYFTAVSDTTVTGPTGPVIDAVGSLYQLASGTGTATQISNTVGPYPIRIMPDYKAKATLNNIWVTSGSSYVSQVTAGTGTGAINGFITTPFNTSGNSYGLAVSQGGSIFVSANDTNAVTSYALSNGTYSLAWPSFAGATAGISTPTAIALDPRSNTWFANNANGTSTGTTPIPTGSVSVISNAPAAISPSTGFQKSQTFLSSGRAIAIDQAGNVWVAGDGANFLTEIVGAAVPVFQPYAVGLNNGRFMTIP